MPPPRPRTEAAKTKRSGAPRHRGARRPGGGPGAGALVVAASPRQGEGATGQQERAVHQHVDLTEQLGEVGLGLGTAQQHLEPVTRPAPHVPPDLVGVTREHCSIGGLLAGLAAGEREPLRQRRGTHVGHDLRHRHRCTAARVPAGRILAASTVQGAALGEDGVSHPGPVNDGLGLDPRDPHLRQPCRTRSLTSARLASLNRSSPPTR